MKNKKWFIFVLILICVCFTTCENPIIRQWWVKEEEEDFDYIALIKSIPEVVYETIIETETIYEYITVVIPDVVIEYVDRPVPPEILMQYIDIIGIEFIIFAGESIVFNGPPERDALVPQENPGIVHGATDLNPEERKTNLLIAAEMTKTLIEEPEYFLILHGHANPVEGTQTEAIILEYISLERAKDVAVIIRKLYYAMKNSISGWSGRTWPSIMADIKTGTITEADIRAITGYTSTDLEDLDKRMTTKGYGGGRNLSSPSSTFAALNRRVEAILFTIETDPIPKPLPDYGQPGYR